MRALLLLGLAFVADAAFALPRFTTTPVTTAIVGSPYSYAIRTADTQGGRREVTAPVLPTWLKLTGVNTSNGRATLSGTPGPAQVGVHSVTLQVTNLSTRAIALQLFTVTVTGSNQAPVITGQTPNPVPLAKGASLTVQLSHLIVTDVDDPYPTGFSLAVLNGPNYTRTGNTITPAANFTGTLSVPVRVNDGTVNSNTFNLLVNVFAGNRPPEIVAPIPSQLGTENQPFQLRDGTGAPTTLAAFFRDPDSGDTLSYEVSGLPPSGNLVANASTGSIAGTPLAADARDTPYVVRVTANDAKAARSLLPTQSFNLTIAAVNRADLALRVDVTPAPSLTNSRVDWVFTVTNSGPQAAGPVDLTAEFAGNPLSFTGLTSCTVSTVAEHQLLDCAIATIAAGATATVTVAAQAAQAGDVGVTAEARPGAAPLDPNLANNRASATLNVAQTLSSGPAQTLPDGRSAAAGDVDGDGFEDLALARGPGHTAEVYLNIVDAANSAKRMLAATPTIVGNTTATAGLVLADLDNDNDLDLVTASDKGQGNVVYINGGKGSFTPLTTLGNGVSNGVAASDLDGDGFVDLVFASSGPNPVYLNQLGKSFVARTSLGDGDNRKVIAVDLDLDSKPDLVFANATGPSRFYRNLGGGAFAAGAIVDAAGAESVASGDFNGDGRPDLVFARSDAGTAIPANPVYQNNAGAGGVPVFVLIAGLGASPTVDVLTTDLDLNGTVDVIAINATGTHQVYLGNGAGGFALHPVQFSSPGANGAALGNFSVDGRKDLVIGGASSSRVFFNDGHGGLGAGDSAPPVITLIGDSKVVLTVGQTYQDAGAAAMDDIDGDLTAQIVVDGTVDPSIVGDYAVNYDVVDKSGNAAATSTRTVQVAPRAGTGGGGGGAADAWLLALLLLASGVPFRRSATRLVALSRAARGS